MTIAAGPFAAWLAAARAALRGDAGIDVPCGDCTGCCTSGYSIQLRPADTRALAAVPAKWLVESAGFAPGQKTLAPRADGTCRMLESGRCTIYADRPQTCLDYDCRVFAAAGIDAGGEDKAVINRRVRAWQFDYPAVMITDMAFYRNTAYHTSGDTYDRLDYARMANVVLGVHQAVLALAGAAP